MGWARFTGNVGEKWGSGYLRLLAVVQTAIICLAVVGCGAASTPVPTPSQEAARAISFMTADGVEIKGRLFGQGPTGVVLAHMYPADQTSWWGFAQSLSQEGYMALTFDFRGYGDSGGDKEIKLIDRDVEAALEFLGGQGGSTIFLVGASMGGTASLKVAARQGLRVAGMVSLSAPVEFKGISIKGEHVQVQVPVLLMATSGNVNAQKSLNSMIEEGIVGEKAESVVYEEGNDHGTDILKGKNGDAARQRILDFLKAHSP